jgi:hypothetical protein
MPDNTRGLLIKKMESALLHLDNAGEILAYMYATYNPGYPDMAEPCLLSMQAIDKIIETLRYLREVM